MRDVQKPIDFVTVRTELVARNQFAELGGDEHILRIMEAVPLTAHFRR